MGTRGQGLLDIIEGLNNPPPRVETVFEAWCRQQRARQLQEVVADRQRAFEIVLTQSFGMRVFFLLTGLVDDGYTPRDILNFLNELFAWGGELASLEAYCNAFNGNPPSIALVAHRAWFGFNALDQNGQNFPLAPNLRAVDNRSRRPVVSIEATSIFTTEESLRLWVAGFFPERPTPPTN